MAKILIADDETEIVSLMAKKINAAGYGVVTAVDGIDAWEKIVVEQPDAVVLDVTMPGIDGFEILKRLRENPPFEKWCPVIIVSAHDELPDIQKGLQMQAEHYLTKPCTADEILKAVEFVLNLSAQRKESGS